MRWNAIASATGCGAQGREGMALFFQSRISERFDVDIHPRRELGRGIMIDHATGVVIGETAVVEDDVSIMHGVTLGGTGKEGGDRHPKIRRGVLLSMGAKILGNIEVGEYSPRRREQRGAEIRPRRLHRRRRARQAHQLRRLRSSVTGHEPGHRRTGRRDLIQLRPPIVL